MTTLQTVDREYLEARRVYVLGLDEDDFANHLTSLEAQGHIVVNREADLVDQIPLREHIAQMMGANTLGIPDAWWTSTVVDRLMTLAGWLQMDYTDERGILMEKVASR